MDKSRWKRIRIILDEALKFSDRKEQDEIIQSACEEDYELYKQVSSLLNSIRKAQATNFLE